MKFNESFSANHLGNGIVQFDNAFSVDHEDFALFISDVENNGIHQGYKKEESKNEGGYVFSEEEFSEAPDRYVGLSGNLNTEKGKEVLQQMNHTIYRCLVKYCKVFPVAMSEVAWETDGYIIKYSSGQSIGPHSDCALPYQEDGITPINSFPLYNTLTTALVLNDDFSGGEIIYRPWGISAQPGAGSVIMYPSCFVGCHEVSPITDGKRYAYLKWFGHGQPGNMNPSLITTLKADVGVEPWEQPIVGVGTV